MAFGLGFEVFQLGIFGLRFLIQGLRIQICDLRIIGFNFLGLTSSILDQHLYNFWD